VKLGAPSHQGFPLDQNFFGFNPKDRVIMHDNLFNIVWHGAGRWTWDDIYHMPIFLRRYWTKRINALVTPPEPTPDKSTLSPRRKSGR
jgi:hypothetical protein